MGIFDDLEAEEDRLAAIVERLGEAQLAAPSDAPGWTICDVLLHLAQSEEAVIAAASGREISFRPPPGMTVDQAMDHRVRSDPVAPADVLARWQEARVGALAALRAADPEQALAWVEVPLKPATLATTRLAEHWAHGLDIARPLGIAFADTARLRHVAWLAHRSLPYAFKVAGERSGEVRCELTAPDGAAIWRYGSPGAPSAIVGLAGAFCRVAAQRLAPEESGLRTEGPHGASALRLLRTYAA